MTIENIKLKEYLVMFGEVLFEYNWVIKYSNDFNEAKNHFNVDIMKCSFGFVKDFQYYLQKDMTWNEFIDLVNHELNITIQEVDILTVFQFKNWLVKEIEKIIEVEGIALDSGITAQDERAGIDKLAPFGVYQQLRQFATTFHQTVDWARAQKYEDAFTELAYQAALNSYQENLLKIRNSST
jgi:hypothetical protein